MTDLIPLDWSDAPLTLDDYALGVWKELADIFGDDETRFRASDRELVAAYCGAASIANLAFKALVDDGATVDGRSRADAGRAVRNPAFGMWQQATTTLRQLAEQLRLSPRSRASSASAGFGPSPWGAS